MKYVWISPRGFANEGTLYSYDPGNSEQVKDMTELIERFSNDPSASVNVNTKGRRGAINIELAVHPERFKPSLFRIGEFDRI